MLINCMLKSILIYRSQLPLPVYVLIVCFDPSQAMHLSSQPLTQFQKHQTNELNPLLLLLPFLLSFFLLSHCWTPITYSQKPTGCRLLLFLLLELLCMLDGWYNIWTHLKIAFSLSLFLFSVRGQPTAHGLALRTRRSRANSHLRRLQPESAKQGKLAWKKKMKEKLDNKWEQLCS